MSEENIRYSREDLAEFDEIIQDKLTAARKEVAFIKETLSRATTPARTTPLPRRRCWKMALIQPKKKA